jgi:two-component system invasion response regulator UvrY
MKILIADDHTIFRKGVKLLLTETFPFAEITDVADSAELLKMLFKNKWDIIISDISMPPGDSGIETLKKIKEYAPGTPVIMLSMHTVKEYAVRAIKAGASGYIVKSADVSDFTKAVSVVLSGRKYLSPEVADAMADAFINDTENHTIDSLSNREYEIFKLLAAGKTISDIANDLVLSRNTISTFRGKIFEKLGFQSNTELMKYAVDHKLI